MAKPRCDRQGEQLGQHFIYTSHKTAALALQAIVAGVAVVKNAALSRAIRRKDQEMNQLILMVRQNLLPQTLAHPQPSFVIFSHMPSAAQQHFHSCALPQQG